MFPFVSRNPVASRSLFVSRNLGRASLAAVGAMLLLAATPGTSVAQHAYGHRGGYHGGYNGGHHGGYNGGHHGGYHGGYNGGHHRGYHGGYHGGTWRVTPYYAPRVYAPSVYYAPPRVYYAPPPAYYPYLTPYD